MPLATSYDIGDRPSQKGARESLDNTIRRTSPESCPLFATLSRGPKAQAILSEWIVDDLDEVKFTGHVDGAPLSFSTGFKDKTVDRVRFGNRIQQFQREFAVSPQAEAVNVAGPDNLYAMSKSKALLEMRRDIEACLGSDQKSQSGSGSQGDKFDALGTWTNPTDVSIYDTADRKKHRSVTASRFNLTGTTSVPGVLTEEKFRQQLQAVYELHGSAPSYKLFGGPAVINSLADMTRVSSSANAFSYQLTQNIGDGVLKLQVQEYISDWGRVYLVPSLFLGRSSGTAFNDTSRNRAYLLPSDSGINLRFLEDIKTIDLDDVDGGGKRGLCRAMLTLSCGSAGKPLGSIV